MPGRPGTVIGPFHFPKQPFIRFDEYAYSERVCITDELKERILKECAHSVIYFLNELYYSVLTNKQQLVGLEDMMDGLMQYFEDVGKFIDTVLKSFPDKQEADIVSGLLEFTLFPPVQICVQGECRIYWQMAPGERFQKICDLLRDHY